MLDTMLDIETLGVSPGAVITNVAVMQFDPSNDEPPRLVLDRFINPELAENAGLRVESETEAFWQRQDAAIRAKVLGGTERPEDVLQDVHDHLRGLRHHRLWVRGISFDIALLAEAFRIVLRLLPPWQHTNIHEVRTTLMDFDLKKGPYLPGEEHLAVGDCMAQIRDVRRAAARKRELFNAWNQVRLHSL